MTIGFRSLQISNNMILRILSCSLHRVVCFFCSRHPACDGLTYSEQSHSPEEANSTQNVVLSQSKKARIWFSIIDILSVVVFVWEVFDENLARQSDAEVIGSPSSEVRLHPILTLWQACLFFTIAITLLQIRQAKASSFGPVHLIFWLAALFLTTVSSAASGIAASAGTRSNFNLLFQTLEGYLTKSLRIRRDGQDVVGEGKAIPSEVVEALKEGSSWIISDSGSNHSPSGLPMKRGTRNPWRMVHSRKATRTRNTKTLGSRNRRFFPITTMTDWSFSENCDMSQGSRNTAMLSSIPCDMRFLLIARRAQPDLSDCDMERAFSIAVRKLPEGRNISWRCISGWLALLWTPSVNPSSALVILSSTCGPVSILLIFSVTMSAPILAFNSLFRPLPTGIPTDLFEDPSSPPNPSKPVSKRCSVSVGLVEGCRSGDIWMSRGDAIEGKGRLNRAIGYLSESRVPKLSDLPFKSATSDECMRQEATKNNPQYDSGATSAFVVINTYCTNEVGWLPVSEMRDVPRSVQIGRDSHPGSCRSAMFLHLLSAGGPAQVQGARQLVGRIGITLSQLPSTLA
ncbi:hypothetical protein ACEPAG_6304 [Sanghuangporus baumii]